MTYDHRAYVYNGEQPDKRQWNFMSIQIGKNTRYCEEKENRYLTPTWNVMIKYLFQDLIGEYEGSGEVSTAECWNNNAVVQIE